MKVRAASKQQVCVFQSERVKKRLPASIESTGVNLLSLRGDLIGYWEFIMRKNPGKDKYFLPFELSCKKGFRYTEYIRLFVRKKSLSTNELIREIPEYTHANLIRCVFDEDLRAFYWLGNAPSK